MLFSSALQTVLPQVYLHGLRWCSNFRPNSKNHHCSFRFLKVKKVPFSARDASLSSVLHVTASCATTILFSSTFVLLQSTPGDPSKPQLPCDWFGRRLHAGRRSLNSTQSQEPNHPTGMMDSAVTSKPFHATRRKWS